MNPDLTALCKQFAINRDEIQRTFIFGTNLLCPVSAMYFVEKHKIANKKDLKNIRNILYIQSPYFSKFKDISRIPTISAMSVAENPEKKLQEILRIYNLLKTEFFASDYLALAALCLSELPVTAVDNQLPQKAKELYKAMRAKHPFLTGEEDAVFCMLLAASPLSLKEILLHTENCYNILNPYFASPNAVQSLSHVLTLLEGDTEEKCNKVISLDKSLKDAGVHYGRLYELASLGTLAILEGHQKDLMSQFLEISSFLDSQEGYGGLLGISKHKKYMHCSMLLSHYYGTQQKEKDSLYTKSARFQATMIAQQITVMTHIILSDMTSHRTRPYLTVHP